MQARITRAMYSALAPVLKKPPFEMDDFTQHHFRDHDWIDLRKATAADLKKLIALCEKNSSIRGMKTLVFDINNWLRASESTEAAGGIRARSVRQAFGLMIEYLRLLPNKHLYQRQQMGNDGVTLCYYIERIAFYEKSRDQRQPEHFRIDLIYEEFDVIKKAYKTFVPQDCISRTAAEILNDSEYMPETPELRAAYLQQIERYSELEPQIGLQCLAVGLADDTGIDGNKTDSDDWWRSSKKSKIILDSTGEPARVVIDIFREEESDRTDRDNAYNTYFWAHQANATAKAITAARDDDELEIDPDEMEATVESMAAVEVPIHPFLACFDLKRHLRLRIHVGNLTQYKYDKQIRSKLILPADNLRLIDTLLHDKTSAFRDVVKGKSGGVIILCQGPPGTGKTLTSEIYAETMERPLYTVQCSQLGTDPNELEDALLKVLARGRRWGAVMLLDEADVYVHERGSDLTQNAIVGVFLRVLEYHAGVLFLTTNRADLVDDAILSRCTARIPYDCPEPELQKRIWEVIADANGLDLLPKTIRQIVAEHPHLSGRDVKNLLKLAVMTARDTGREIDSAMIADIKRFKPTTGEHEK